MEWLKNPGILEINTWVWLREPTEKYPEFLEEFRRTLADFQTEDVSGSPYSIRRYRVDPKLGGREGLADRPSVPPCRGYHPHRW
jgi:hypothetical protein